MDYKRELPIFSGVYSPMQVRRFIVETLGGFFPVMQKLPDGRLGIVARGGDFHVGERGTLIFLTSSDGGESWSHPTIIADDGPDNRNPSFGVAADGTLIVSHVTVDRYKDGYWDREGKGGSTNIRISRSEDCGATWSSSELMNGQGNEDWSGSGATGPNDPHRFYSPYGKMLTLADGTLLMDYHIQYTHPPRKSAVFITRSKDGGRTWIDTVRIAEDHDETALCDLGNGHILAVMRTSDTINTPFPTTLQQAESTDGGYTWSEPRIITGDGEYPADVIRLNDGRLLLTYGRRVPPHGVQGMISHDDGKTWDTEHKLFLVGDSSTLDCGYPSSVQLDTGEVVTAYYACDPVSVGEEASRRLGAHAASLIYQP